MPTHHSTASGSQRRRADAERSIARILAATLDALAGDPEVSMAEIARRAGVVRATIYVHFPTREALVDAVTRRAIADVTEAIDRAEPERGDAADALRRIVATAWRKLGRYHALVAINTQLPAAELRARHEPVLARLRPVIARGQREGSIRSGIGPAWHLSMILALIHAASGEVRAGRIPDDEAEAALVRTVLGALAP